MIRKRKKVQNSRGELTQDMYLKQGKFVLFSQVACYDIFEEDTTL